MKKNFTSLSHLRKEWDPELDPDPLVRGTDPDPRQMSRIPNTGFYSIKESRTASWLKPKERQYCNFSLSA
jgi:hypothetical protein